MDKLKQLESFVAVAAKGGLTAAAAAEGVGDAVVGRRIDALEERLGVKLAAWSPTAKSLRFKTALWNILGVEVFSGCPSRSRSC